MPIYALLLLSVATKFRSLITLDIFAIQTAFKMFEDFCCFGKKFLKNAKCFLNKLKFRISNNENSN